VKPLTKAEADAEADRAIQRVHDYSTGKALQTPFATGWSNTSGASTYVSNVTTPATYTVASTVKAG